MNYKTTKKRRHAEYCGLPTVYMVLNFDENHNAVYKLGYTNDIDYILDYKGEHPEGDLTRAYFMEDAEEWVANFLKNNEQSSYGKGWYSRDEVDPQLIEWIIEDKGAIRLQDLPTNFFYLSVVNPNKSNK